MKNSSITAILFYLVVAVFWQSGNALACSCDVIPREAVYEASDVVVVGRVIKMRIVGEKRHARVEVTKTIKGSTPSGDIIEFVTNIDTSECGYPFVVSDKPITIVADHQNSSTPFVDNCMMYSLIAGDRAAKRAYRAAMKANMKADMEAEKAKEAQKVAEVKKPQEINNNQEKITTASCLEGNQTGSAKCEAICPKGRTVLNCSYNVGSFSSGDTCTSLSRNFTGSTGASGQPTEQPHDRCSVSAVCSVENQTLSVQAWASCIRP